MAVGVARPKAHGQAITSTAINIVRENIGVSPAINQPTEAITASPITTGTK